ncbi:hypothetical protein POM88_021691 [Heracleum sosnowskyi]|uniref:Retrotransposon gag domain-containing protein n=1 Tax=Heracleum sosnowskyi TaxID=360622 RepID=A0AAD8MSR7_9APIA|nr:hypothetical protein POM88_021691 [Heracleum sosnowskyi]
MARGSKSTNRHTPSNPAPDTSIPVPGQAGNQIPPVLTLASQVIRPGDARVNIEVNKYKYTDLALEPGQMENLTGEQVAEAIRLYNQTRNKEQDQCENSHHPEGSHRSRSVFDRIGDKDKDTERRPHRTRSRNNDEETEKLKRLAEMREKIQAEEQARLDLRVQKRIQEEEAWILGKTSEKRRTRAPSPEIISDEDEPKEDLMNMIHELQRKVDQDSGIDIGDTFTPFSYSLEATPRQRNIKHYNFDSFNGLDDPEEHVNYFEQIAMIYYYNDLTKCRFFASTLKSGAQRWFNRIPSRSIHSWKQFRDSFLKRFRANRTHEMHMCHLEIVRQARGEALSSYMKRFQEAINNITNLDEREALTIFRRNLDPDNNERYVLDLIHKEPQSLAAAYAMAARFIKETDVLQAMRMTKQGISPTRIQDPPKNNFNHQDKKFKLNRQSNYIQSSQLAFPTSTPNSNQSVEPGQPKQKLEPRPEPNWTPHNRDRADILKEVRDKPFYYPPKPMATGPENRSVHKHCDYHETHGHTTENCLSLKFFVE